MLVKKSTLRAAEAELQRLQLEISSLQGSLAEANRESVSYREKLEAAFISAKKAEEHASTALAASQRKEADLGAEIQRRFDETATLTRLLKELSGDDGPLGKLKTEQALARNLTRALAQTAGNQKQGIEVALGLPPLSVQLSSVITSDLFNGEWYRKDSSIPFAENFSPELHYITIGTYLGSDPGPKFSTMDYYRANPDVAATGFCALVHYLIFGQAEQRRIRPVNK